jgi:hypothetical protein
MGSSHSAGGHKVRLSVERAAAYSAGARGIALHSHIAPAWQDQGTDERQKHRTGA